MQSAQCRSTHRSSMYFTHMIMYICYGECELKKWQSMYATGTSHVTATLACATKIYTMPYLILNFFCSYKHKSSKLIWKSVVNKNNTVLLLCFHCNKKWHHYNSFLSLLPETFPWAALIKHKGKNFEIAVFKVKIKTVDGCCFKIAAATQTQTVIFRKLYFKDTAVTIVSYMLDPFSFVTYCFSMIIQGNLDRLSTTILFEKDISRTT